MRDAWGNYLTIEVKSNRKQMAAIYRWIDSVAAKISKENQLQPASVTCTYP